MSLKSTSFLLISLIAVSLLFSQCQSNKIAFGNKYYFKQQPRTAPATATIAAKPEALEPVVSQGLAEEPMLTASIKREVVQQPTVTNLIEEAKADLAENIEAGEMLILKQRAEKIKALAQSSKDQRLDRKERKASRKEMKKEVKALVKEYNAIKSTQESNFLDDLDDNLRKAIIFWGIGVIFSIISSFVPFMWILASISYLVGTIFFILWLVEELD